MTEPNKQEGVNRAYGRMIRKDISRSHGFASLSPSSQVLFCMLIPHFDSHGKMNGDPFFIKGEVVPLIKWLTVEKIMKCLQEIHRKTNVKHFTSKKLKFLHSINWLEHQKIRIERIGSDRMPTYNKLSDKGFPKTHSGTRSRSTPGELQDDVGTTPGELLADSRVTPPVSGSGSGSGSGTVTNKGVAPEPGAEPSVSQELDQSQNIWKKLLNEWDINFYKLRGSSFISQDESEMGKRYAHLKQLRVDKGDIKAVAYTRMWFRPDEPWSKWAMQSAFEPWALIDKKQNVYRKFEESQSWKTIFNKCQLELLEKPNGDKILADLAKNVIKTQFQEPENGN